MSLNLMAQDTQAPPTPGELTLVSTTHNSVTVTWDNVATDGGMMGYLVYLDGAQEQDTILIGEMVGYTDDYPEYRETGNSSDYRILYYTAYDLVPGTSYSIEVAAIDSALNVSDKSPAIDVVTEASAPEGSFILYPTDDANIIGGSGNYMSFNMGEWDYLQLNTHANFDGWHSASRPFIKFDISAVDDVSSATLKMFGGLWGSQDWLDEQPITTIKVAFYEVGADWEEETITFSSVPDEDIGADLEGNPQKDAVTNYDTLQKYTPVSYTTITNDPAKLGVSAPAQGENIKWTWFDANFKPFMDAQMAEGSETLSFTMVDTTFSKYTHFRFFSKDAYANRLHLVVEGSVTANQITLDKSFQVFPNPLASNGSLRISFLEIDDYSVSIMDITGKQIHKSEIKNSNNFRLNVGGLSLNDGIYFIRATNSEGVSGVKKVIIR
jgi:hypothetical protein